jgi:hypothetical protein
MAQPEREVRGLRNDLRVSCEALYGRVGGVSAQLAEVVDADGHLLEALQDVRGGEDDLVAALAPVGGLGVRLLGQVSPLETLPTEGSQSESDDSFASLEAAVVSNTETANSDMWGIAGFFVGIFALFGVYKLVRP